MIGSALFTAAALYYSRSIRLQKVARVWDRFLILKECLSTFYHVVAGLVVIQSYKIILHHYWVPCIIDEARIYAYKMVLLNSVVQFRHLHRECR